MEIIAPLILEEDFELSDTAKKELAEVLPSHKKPQGKAESYHSYCP